MLVYIPSQNFLVPQSPETGSRFPGEEATDAVDDVEGFGSVGVLFLECSRASSCSSSALMRCFNRSISLNTSVNGGGVADESVPVRSWKCPCFIYAFVAAQLAPALAVGAGLMFITLGTMRSARIASSGDLMTLRPYGGRSRGRRSAMLTVGIAIGRFPREGGEHGG